MILIVIEEIENISTYLMRRIGEDREHNVVDLCRTITQKLSQNTTFIWETVQKMYQARLHEQH